MDQQKRNIFSIVKQSVTPVQAASFYGLKVNSRGMCRCPFHDDHTPSLKLYDDHYYCFGCGATGDVIDLVSQLFDLSPYEAAKKIAEDFGIDPDKPPTAAALAKPKHPMINAIRDDERYCHRVLWDYLHLLTDWKVQYAPTSMDEDPDDRFVEACQMLDYVKCLADILAFGNPEDRVVTVKTLMKDGMITGLEARLDRAKEEDHAKEESAAG